VRQYLPDAKIDFDHDTGGRELSDNYLIDNTRFTEEFGEPFQPIEERVRQTINEVRCAHDLPAV